MGWTGSRTGGDRGVTPSKRWLWGLAAVAATGCATFGWHRDITPDQQLDRAAIALRDGRYAMGWTELSWLAEHCADQTAGRRATLELAAAAIDPRNPYRSPTRAANAAARYLRLQETEPALEPVAQTLYLVALEMGGRPDHAATRVREASARLDPAGPAATAAADPARADSSADACGRMPVRLLDAVALPALHAPTFPERIERLAAERDSLQHRLDLVVVERDSLRQQAKQLQQELKRVKKILKP